MQKAKLFVRGFALLHFKSLRVGSGAPTELRESKTSTSTFGALTLRFILCLIVAWLVGYWVVVGLGPHLGTFNFENPYLVPVPWDK